VLIAGLILAATALAIVPYLAWPIYLGRLRRELTRAERIARIAAELGLAFSPGDPAFPGSTALRYPFELFSRGERQVCENVSRGTLAGRAVVAFDLLGYSEGDPEPIRWSCVLVEVGGNMPHVLVEPASAVPEIPAEHDGERVLLEWADFNARYRVFTPQRGFAAALLDLEVMTWLVDAAPHLALVWEVQRGFVLCRAQGLPAEAFHELVTAAIEVARRVPKSAGSAV
jgi:hypothetical protein